MADGGGGEGKGPLGVDCKRECSRGGAQMKRECSLFAIAILSVACDQKPAPKLTLPPVSLVKPSAPPAAPAQAMYVYSPMAKGDPKRDPFQSNQSVRPRAPDGRIANLLQKWPVGDLRVSFTL